jgi:MFS family permease
LPDVAASERAAARRAGLAIAPGALLAGVAGGIAFPILPLVGVHFGLPLWYIGVILAANRGARLLSAPVVGLLTDRFGGRRVLLAGLVLQIGVMALYLLGMIRSQPGLYFLLARLLHGPGSACVFVGAQTLALHAGGRAHGGLVAGIVRAAQSAGMPVGLAAGGLLAAFAGEANTFAAALVAIVVGMVVGFFTVPDLRAPHSKGTRQGAWRMLADRRLLAVGVLNFSMFFAAQGVVLTTIVLLVSGRGVHLGGLGDQGTAGLAMGWMVLVASATMAVTGRLGDRFRSHARIAAMGLLVTVPGLLVVGLGQTLAALAAGVALVGLGMGALGPSVLALLAALVEPEERGRATGALQLCGDFGGVLGPIAGTLLVSRGQAAPYLGAAAILVLALPVALWLARLERRAVRSPSGAGAESIEGIGRTSCMNPSAHMPHRLQIRNIM